MVSKTQQFQLRKTDIAWLLCVLVSPTAGYWHVWQWYIHRVAHSLEESVGLIILAAYVAFISGKGIIEQKAFKQVPLAPLVILLLLYAATFLLSVPPIIQAAIALLNTFYILYRIAFASQPPVSFWGLILLCLPVVPSLQFYLGFPVRYVSAFLTVPLLRLNGVSVHQEGTNLLWSGQVLQFDAPCSGVTMLWAGLFYSLFMSFIFRFTLAKTVLAVLVAFLIVLAGNVVRASSLFYLEIGALSGDAAGLPLENTSWLHEAIGSAAYVFVVACIIFTLSQYQYWSNKTNVQ